MVAKNSTANNCGNASMFVRECVCACMAHVCQCVRVLACVCEYVYKFLTKIH